MEALKERGLLRAERAAPGRTTSPSSCPNYEWWEAPFYGVGLKIYNLLAGKCGFGRSAILSREETLGRLPTMRPTASAAASSTTTASSTTPGC